MPEADESIFIEFPLPVGDLDTAVGDLPVVWREFARCNRECEPDPEVDEVKCTVVVCKLGVVLVVVDVNEFVRVVAGAVRTECVADTAPDTVLQMLY